MAEMNQSQIDDLLKQSMDGSSLDPSQLKQPPQKQNLQESYGGEQFESYDQSKSTFTKDTHIHPRTGSFTLEVEESKRFVKTTNKLQRIDEETSHKNLQAGHRKSIQKEKAVEKEKAKTGIYFPPKKPPPSSKKQNKFLPYNYNRLQQREKQLLLTTLAQENKQLKQSLAKRQKEYKTLDGAYKVILEEKTKATTSAKEQTLQKQVSVLQSKCEKLEQLCRTAQQKNAYKGSLSKTAYQHFIPEEEADNRDRQSLLIIDKLKERLMASDKDLKTLQAKMNEGQDYVEELRRKLKRVQQLQHRIDRMTEQAQNDAQFITHLKDKVKHLDHQLGESKHETKTLELQIKRLEMSTYTQRDVMDELKEVKRQKELLENSLKDLSSNLIAKTFKSNLLGGESAINSIDDSEQILKIG